MRRHCRARRSRSYSRRVPHASAPLRNAPGRPAATSRRDIERAAFALFERKGFSGTTLDDIADAVGVSRRTLFRYFPSKNDIPWGRFDETLDAFAELLRQMPRHLPVHEAVQRGVLAFNDFPASALDEHRERMRLVLSNPELQAHSVLQYEAWRSVVARFVADRTGGSEHDLVPQAVSRVTLALALAAYEDWLDRPGAELSAVLRDAVQGVRLYFGHSAGLAGPPPPDGRSPSLSMASASA
jgi:mycofactocin system transcriptional regulator